MSDIFICPGDCDFCYEEKCPQRGIIKQRSRGDLLADIEQSIAEKITIESVFGLIQGSQLFNVIEGWKILIKEGTELSKADIEKEILRIAPQVLIKYKEKSFGKIIMAKISQIVEIISKSLEGKCNKGEENCLRCFYAEYCPQKRKDAGI